MLKEKALDRSTIDTYHAWVQQGIKDDLNSVCLGPGRLPFKTAVVMIILGLGSLLIGTLLIALRMKHVYLWDWDAQFLGPFFVILFLLCMAAATYLIILAKRRSNKYRSQLYFKPVGDWGINCVHKSELAREDEMKHDLKSGTTPHKNVKPRSEAYSQSGRERRAQPPAGYGKDNRGYDKTPMHPEKSFRPDDHHRRGPPPDGRRGPPPNGHRGPPPDRRGGPPPDRRGGPPPMREPPPEYRPTDERQGPPHDRPRRSPPPGRRSSPPGERRSPPPGVRRSPPQGGLRSPPPGGRRSPPAGVRRSPPPRRHSPLSNVHRGDEHRPPPPGGAARIPPDEGRRPRGVPRFGDVEMIPDDDRNNYKLVLNKSRDDSDI